jgi:hypothetical protein
MDNYTQWIKMHGETVKFDNIDNIGCLANM